MVLRMKNVNIFGIHWKIRLLGGDGLEKPIYKGGGLPKKGGGLGQFVDLRGGEAWQERVGWCFWGGVDTPMPTMPPSWPNPTHQFSFHIYTGSFLGNLEWLFFHKVMVAEKIFSLWCIINDVQYNFAKNKIIF